MKKALVVIYLLISGCYHAEPFKNNIYIDTVPNAKIDIQGNTYYTPTLVPYEPHPNIGLTITKRCYVPKSITISGEKNTLTGSYTFPKEFRVNLQKDLSERNCEKVYKDDENYKKSREFIIKKPSPEVMRYSQTNKTYKEGNIEKEREYTKYLMLTTYKKEMRELQLLEVKDFGSINGRYTRTAERMMDEGVDKYLVQLRPKKYFDSRTRTRDEVANYFGTRIRTRDEAIDSLKLKPSNVVEVEKRDGVKGDF